MVYSQRVLDRSFGALAHPARRQLLETLSRGPASVGEASVGLRLSKAAVTEHVRVLEDAGLVARDVEGRTHRLRLVPPRLETPRIGSKSSAGSGHPSWIRLKQCSTKRVRGDD